MAAWARRYRAVLVLVGVAVAAVLVCVWVLVVAAPRGAGFPWSLPPGRMIVVTREQYQQIVRLRRLVEVSVVVAFIALVAATVLTVRDRRASDRRSPSGR